MHRSINRLLPRLIPLLLAFSVLLPAEIFTAVAAAPGEEQADSALLGDMTNSGSVTAADARSILRAAVSLDALPYALLPYADIDGDGTLTAADARIALRAAVSLEESVRHRYAVTICSEPACTSAGALTYRCVYCGAAGEMQIPAVGHRFGQPEIVAPTCTTDGKSEITCSACGSKEITVLPATGHVWEQDDSSITCKTCGAGADGWIHSGRYSFYCIDGAKQKSWTQIGNEFYFFSRLTGILIRNRTVDGLTLNDDGQPERTDYARDKIKTLLKAKAILASITEPDDSLEDKKLKCFQWVMQFPYKQYRLVGESMQTQGWEMRFANDIFDRASGCCGSTSCAFAFLAVEAGCSAVYVCDDGLSTGGHAWVSMQGSNKIYDVVFAKEYGLSGYYNAYAADYRRDPPRKSYIGG